MTAGQSPLEVTAIQNLLEEVARIGKEHPSVPPLRQVEPFDHFFRDGGTLDESNLDRRDGACTRREVLSRFLLLNAVLDQGPDITGVRQLLVDVTNELYRREVRFLHRPLAFFEDLGIGIEQILEKHSSVSAVRAEIWARENLSKASRYNLFMDNSRQVLSYAVFRWGVPLALPLLLEREAEGEHKSTALLDYLERWESAERMSEQLKDNPRYGLGKAIGDKACHLLAKWLVATWHLSRRSGPSWGPFSFEVPYDSNAGRVLWRTGYFLAWATEEAYRRAGVIQPGKGKGGKHYLRVTNIRGLPVARALPQDLRKAYDEVVINHLRTHKRPPRQVEVHRIQHAILLLSSSGLGVAELDDGLIHIGTRYCKNHEQPACSECPIGHLCEGHARRPVLIADYRT